MFVVCAWCNRDMGEKEPLEDTSVTHGMCKACLKKELRKGVKMDIKELRQKHNLTQQQLAVKLGVSLTTVARWEAGRSQPSPMARQKLEELAHYRTRKEN